MTVTIHCGTTQFKYSGVKEISEFKDDSNHFLYVKFKDHRHSEDKHNMKMINFINVQMEDVNL